MSLRLGLFRSVAGAAVDVISDTVYLAVFNRTPNFAERGMGMFYIEQDKECYAGCQTQLGRIYLWVLNIDHLLSGRL